MSELSEIICREIAAQGVISFARFMELALYHPGLGYYERQSKQIGCQGDFYSSVAVGSMFGELLAWQFTQWLADLGTTEAGRARISERSHHVNSSYGEEVPSRSPLLVEAGAHDGQLALDILTRMERFKTTWLDRIEYWILEPSLERQRRQQEKLMPFAPRVRWFFSWASPALRGIQGVIFSNELLDALPVHRIGWDAKTRRWFEWGVSRADDHFAWKAIPIEPCESGRVESPICCPQLPNELLAVLPDGFTTEISPAAMHWWHQAAGALARGKLITLDYGLSSDDFFVPERADGTVRSYLQHHCSGDLLARPGDQDLTAHVNFTALQERRRSRRISN